MESRAFCEFGFTSWWHAEQGLVFVVDFPRLLHRAVMVRGGQNWSLDRGYSLAFDSVAEELEQLIQVFFLGWPWSDS